MASNIIDIIIKISRFGKFVTIPLIKIQKGFSNLGRGLKRVGAFAKKVGKGLGIVGAALGLVGGFALKAAGNFEKQRVAFETMLGSAEKADKLLKQIEEFSAATPFQLPSILEGSKRLLAFGIAADEVVAVMGRLGDLAQGDQEKLDRLTDAFGKLRAKGKASLEEINRFTEAGVPLIDELAKTLGVTTQEVLSLVSKGKVGFEEVEQAVKKLTSEGGKFFELTLKQSRTLSGLLSTLKDNFGLLARDIGNELLPIIKPLISVLIHGLRQVRGQLPELLVSFQKFWIDVKTEAIIRLEAIREIIAAPFKFETYKLIFGKLLREFTAVFSAIKSIASRGIQGVRDYLARVRAEELADTRTFEEEIADIRHSAQLAKWELDRKLIIRRLALAKEESDKIVAVNDKTNALLIKQDREAQEQRLKDFATFSSFIQGAVQSENVAVAAIAKAAAIFQIGVDTHRAAMSAFSALAGIPVVGPALGVAAAGAAIAFGAEQIAAVSSATPGFEDGGFIPGNSFSGDNVRVRANSAELLLNQKQQQQLLALANGEGGGGKSSDLQVNLNVDGKKIAEAVVQGYNTGRNLDIIPRLSNG